MSNPNNPNESWQRRYLGVEVTHPKLQEAVDHATAFARWYHKDERLFRKCVFVLCGDTGTGKTHIARSLYRWARHASGRMGTSEVFFSWPEACDLIQEGFDGLIHDCIEAHFLVLDDIGAESDRYKTGIFTDKLCQILSRREEQFTILTTNAGPSEWGSRFDVRIADRFIRNSHIIDLTGVPSYSITKLMEV